MIVDLEIMGQAAQLAAFELATMATATKNTALAIIADLYLSLKRYLFITAYSRRIFCSFNVK